MKFKAPYKKELKKMSIFTIEDEEGITLKAYHYRFEINMINMECYFFLELCDNYLTITLKEIELINKVLNKLGFKDKGETK